MDFCIDRLISGGIMTNYNCTVQCAHCRHNASPKRKKGFISEEMLDKILNKLEELNCQSVHIEGGEPFIYPEELIRAVKQINKSTVQLEHIVTNCSWYRNKKDAFQLLKSLQKNGLQRLLLKVGPFQNEHIPLKKVQKVVAVADQLGINIMIWDNELYPEVAAFDVCKTHSIKKYIRTYGDDYIRRIARKISVTFAGRSFDAYSGHLMTHPLEKILQQNKTCSQDYPTQNHFHVDLNGKFSFSHTQGVTIDLEDLGKPIDETKYPFLNVLFHQGINGIYNLATEQYNYTPKKEYLSKCHLCYDIRKHLVVNKNIRTPELQPVEYYTC